MSHNLLTPILWKISWAFNNLLLGKSENTPSSGFLLPRWVLMVASLNLHVIFLTLR